MNKTSDEFDKECGAKGDQWKGGKGAMGGRDSRTDNASHENLVLQNSVRESLIIEKWDCCMKNETMKNGTAMMGKDEWDQFDKTKVTIFIYKI